MITGTPTSALALTQFTIRATDDLQNTTTATLSLSVSSCDVLGSPYGYGSGSVSNPYLICTPNQLQNVSSTLSANYRLDSSLDLTGVSFSPLGSTGTPFTGVFNGNGNTIAHLTINQSSVNNIGLFGDIGSNAVVQNLTLSQVSITGYFHVGALAG